MRRDDPLGSEWATAVGPIAELRELFASVALSICASDAAARVGLRDAAALGAWLVARRMPPFRVLRDWYYVVRLVELSHTDSLCRWALSGGNAPEVSCRFVERVTGESWSTVRARGVAFARQRALDVWRPYREVDWTAD